MKIRIQTAWEVTQALIALTAWAVAIAAVAKLFEPVIWTAEILIAVAISLAAIASGWRTTALVIGGIAMFLLSWPVSDHFGIWPGMLIWLAGILSLVAAWAKTLRELSGSGERSTVSS